MVLNSLQSVFHVMVSLIFLLIFVHYRGGFAGRGRPECWGEITSGWCVVQEETKQLRWKEGKGPWGWFTLVSYDKPGQWKVWPLVTWALISNHDFAVLWGKMAFGNLSLDFDLDLFTWAQLLDKWVGCAEPSQNTRMNVNEVHVYYIHMLKYS